MTEPLTAGHDTSGTPQATPGPCCSSSSAEASCAGDSAAANAGACCADGSAAASTDSCCSSAGTEHHDDDDACGCEHGEVTEELPPWWRDLLVPVASGVALLAGFVLDRFGAPTASLIGYGIALLIGGWTFAPGAIRRLRRGKLGVGLLMLIAAVGAVALGHVGEAATLAFLFSFAEALEDRAMRQARHGLRALLDLIPQTACVLRGEEMTVLAAEVESGDLLVVRPGERVPTDGVVTAGRSHIDTSAVTGESIPVEVGPGDPVSAGSINGGGINGGGLLRVEATAPGHDNSLTQIVELVEQAHARKGDRARLADSVARRLIPGVLVLAAALAVLGVILGEPSVWIERALVVLVAASPCALAISVPVTVISAIGAASRMGVVVTSGQAFEQLGAVAQVALDKTGTLTRNAPEVVAVVPAPGFTSADVLRAAAVLEQGSTHPLAAAILAAAPTPTVPAGALITAPVPAAESAVTEHAGLGLSGVVAGAEVRVGSTRWLDAGALAADAEALEARGMTVVVCALDGAAAGVIGIRDELRPEAAETVRALREAGIEPIMITGDNARTAHAIAQAAGITRVHAEQLPAGKAALIEELGAERVTAMVGDGINDAPALAAADVGIALGTTGSAIAVESADVALTGTDLRLLPAALLHARRGRRIMTGNLVLSIALIVVLLPLAVTGVLGLAGVVIVHEAGEVIVVLNGLRAARVPRRLPQ